MSLYLAIIRPNGNPSAKGFYNSQVIGLAQGQPLLGINTDVYVANQYTIEQGFIDAAIYRKKNNGTSMTVLEAMSLGIPSVAAKVGGAPEIIQHQKSGLLTQNNHQAKLCIALTRIHTLADEQQQFGQKSKSFYLDKFVTREICRDYHNPYQQVIA